jgi:FkbM family methyltransferase
VLLDVNGRSIVNHTLHDGSFQFALFKVVAENYANRSALFINVGANIGTTCLNAHHFGFRRFIAFEPVASNFRLLTHNLAQIEADGEVRRHQQAAGSTAGRMPIHLNPNSTGRHSMVRDFAGGEEDVEIVRLDDVLPREPGFLWIDTEGFELEVVKGGRQFISQHAEGLCIEVTPEALGAGGVEELSDLLEPRFGRCLAADGTSVRRIKDIAALRQGRQADVICLA